MSDVVAAALVLAMSVLASPLVQSCGDSCDANYKSIVAPRVAYDPNILPQIPPRPPHEDTVSRRNAYVAPSERWMKPCPYPFSNPPACDKFASVAGTASGLRFQPRSFAHSRSEGSELHKWNTARTIYPSLLVPVVKRLPDLAAYTGASVGTIVGTPSHNDTDPSQVSLEMTFSLPATTAATCQLEYIIANQTKDVWDDCDVKSQHASADCMWLYTADNYFSISTYALGAGSISVTDTWNTRPQPDRTSWIADVAVRSFRHFNSHTLTQVTGYWLRSSNGRWTIHVQPCRR